MSSFQNWGYRGEPGATPSPQTDAAAQYKADPRHHPHHADMHHHKMPQSQEQNRSSPTHHEGSSAYGRALEQGYQYQQRGAYMVHPAYAVTPQQMMAGYYQNGNNVAGTDAGRDPIVKKEHDDTRYETKTEAGCETLGYRKFSEPKVPAAYYAGYASQPSARAQRSGSFSAEASTTHQQYPPSGSFAPTQEIPKRESKSPSNSRSKGTGSSGRRPSTSSSIAQSNGMSGRERYAGSAPITVSTARRRSRSGPIRGPQSSHSPSERDSTLLHHDTGSSSSSGGTSAPTSSPLKTYKCETCGKVYKHPNCLSKHKWEHTEHWKEAAKFSLSKHQQVQLLEAASILVAFGNAGRRGWDAESGDVLRRKSLAEAAASGPLLDEEEVAEFNGVDGAVVTNA
ncbi:hypothetical protein HK104_002949 [Borealophlyctis nickersoniae]|nr:hypothetical protein HK104_002949 [Borealophlyctis nickersoniae]